MKTLLLVLLLASIASAQTIVIPPGGSLRMEMQIQSDGTTIVTVGGGGSTQPPLAPPSNALPVGFLDVIQGMVAYGWSYDPDSSAQSNSVDIYVDTVSGPMLLGIATANQSRPDINQAFGIAGNHGWSFAIPAQYVGYQISAYGKDLTFGSKLLSGSPKLAQ